MRAVLDVNVLLSALLSSSGPPAQIVVAWLSGAFELVHSALLLEELRRALAYPKIRRRVPADDGDRLVALLLQQGASMSDPDEPAPIRTSDPRDDYLVALAASAGALLVTGDEGVLEIADRAPIHTPAEFLDLIR